MGGGVRRDWIGHGVIQPQLGELSQGGEIREAEVVRQCRVHPVLGDDEALGQPVPERRGCKVDELDLAGPEERVRHRLGRAYAGDPGDELAERLDVGDVEGRVDVDAACQQLFDVLPALAVAFTGEVRVGELVYHGQPRAPAENRPGVQLLKARVPVGDRAGGKHFEVVELGGGLRPPVPFPLGDDGVGAGPPPGARVPHHRVRLPHPGGDPQIGPQPAAVGTRLHRVMCRSLNGEIRLVPKLGRGAIGHHWIRSDMHTLSGGRRVRPEATGAATKVTGGLIHVMPRFEQAAGHGADPDAIRSTRHMPGASVDRQPEPDTEGTARMDSGRLPDLEPVVPHWPGRRPGGVIRVDGPPRSPSRDEGHTGEPAKA